MPGFIIHLAEARRIVDVMKTEYGEDGLYELYERFALGCILPDITDDKEKTHFRPEWQKNLITKYPDIDLVLKAYEGKQLTPEDMGIITHLRMDQLYVERLWPEYFTFKDANGRETKVWADISYVDMKSGGRVPLNTFFSEEYFYGDYDVLNPSIIKNVQPEIPKGDIYVSDHIHIPGYDKVTGAMIDEALAAYCFNCTDMERDTRVFSYEVIMEFIDYCVRDMIEIIKKLKDK